MREEQVPATVAPEHFQTQQGFVASLAPELARALEPTLGLSAGCFNGSAANRFAGTPPSPTIHPFLMVVKVIDFFGNRLCAGPLRSSGQDLLQLSDDFDGGFIFQLVDQWFEPGLELGFVCTKERPARLLFPMQDNAGSATLSAEERTRAQVHRECATRKLKMARVLGEGGFGEEARLALVEAIHTFAGALAVEHRLPEPPELKDALQPPLSHFWAEALPALRTFVQEPGSDWKPVAECLARV